jgi:hypothetical protein
MRFIVDVQAHCQPPLHRTCSPESHKRRRFMPSSHKGIASVLIISTP